KFAEAIYRGEENSCYARYSMGFTSLAWTKYFLKTEYAQSPLIKPFAEGMQYVEYPPLVEGYQEWRGRVAFPISQ
ncbi:unnamed protein product, partial [marine sediment metagenome]